MAAIHVLSAGAAQSVVEKTTAPFTRETGCEVKAAFGAVGAMKARVIAGEPVDVIILTAALIDELIASNRVVSGSRRDIGRVGTGVAVRSGTPLIDVSSENALRGNLLVARRIVFPDPAIATAGKVVMRALETLAIVDEVRPRLQFFPNGYAAMRWLAQSRELMEIGITQTTEILANPGVTYAGALPDALQMKTVYSAGVAAGAPSAEVATEFITRLTDPAARSTLEAAGYELGE